MNTDWIWGLAGGGLIGLAGALYLLANGRIMGASGIIGGLLDGSGRGTNVERLWFIAGLFGCPAVLALAIGAPETHLTANLGAITIAGLLVGIGTRIANGCTSGHGVCGISRLSWRGLIATAFYILAGGITVVVARQIWGVI